MRWDKGGIQQKTFKACLIASSLFQMVNIFSPYAQQAMCFHVCYKEEIEMIATEKFHSCEPLFKRNFCRGNNVAVFVKYTKVEGKQI